MRRMINNLASVLVFGMCAEVLHGQETTSSPKEQLVAVLERSSAALSLAEDRNGLVEVKQAGLPFGSVRGFDASAVASTVSSIREDLTAALTADELSGLEAYVDEFFPEASVKTMPIDLASAQETTCSVSPCPAQLAEAESVTVALASVKEFVGKVASATAYKVRFLVRSKPTGARFSLQPLGGGFLTEVATDGTVGEVFRGLYRYTVARQGYKTTTATLNLVDNDVIELQCELIAEHDPADPLPCLFGVIE